MINIPNAIPSTLMIESYSNKIKKLLKYGNTDAVKWQVVGDDSPGETEVVLTLPSGNTKSVKVERFDIAEVLSVNLDGEVLIDIDAYYNIPNAAETQKAIAEASNLNIRNNNVLYSEEFAMSNILWLTKGVYVPPQDMQITIVTDATSQSNGVKKQLTINENSLGYVGSVTIVIQSANAPQEPVVSKEYNLSTMSNIGEPGKWVWKSYSPDGWGKEYIIKNAMRDILTMIATVENISDIDGLINYVEDTSNVVEGQTAIKVTPGQGNPLATTIGELDIIIEDLGPGDVYSVANISYSSNQYFTQTGAGRYSVSVPEVTTNADIIEMYEMMFSNPVYNRVHRSESLDNPSWVDRRGYLTYEFNDNVLTVRPTPETEFKKVIGLQYITINRHKDPVEPVTVTEVLSELPIDGTYNVSPDLTIEDINYNIVKSIVDKYAFNPKHKVTSADLVVVNDGSIVTVVPTEQSAGVYVNIDAMLTLHKVIETEVVLNLYQIYNASIDEPDYDAPDYSVENVVMQVINAKLVELGKGDVIIDLSKMNMRYQLDWDRWYVSVQFALLDSQLDGSFSIELTNTKPAVMRTDLSSMSNIGKPGQMMLSKEFAPKSWVNQDNLSYIFANATIGTFVDESLGDDRAIQRSYNNGLAVLTSTSAIKPGTIVGELRVIYVDYTESGTWLPKLNLSEITNIDQNGIWGIDLPGDITLENYIAVGETVKNSLSKIYKLDTSALISRFEDGLLKIAIDPNLLVDANGVLTVQANVTQGAAVPPSALRFTAVTSAEAELDELPLTLRMSELLQNNKEWNLWKNDKLIATSEGLLFDNNISVSEPWYNDIMITFDPEFFVDKTVSVALDGNGKKISLNNIEPGTSSAARTITVDKFHDKCNQQSFQVGELVKVPDVLPPHITDCGSMFAGAVNFNQDISGWDVSNVKHMPHMFAKCTSFNQDIGRWDVRNVIEFTMFLNGATAFDQDLSGWCVSNYSEKPYSFSSLPSEKLPRWGLCPSKPLTELNAFDLSAVKQGDGEVGYLSIDSNLSGGIIGNETALAEQTVAELNALYTLELTIEDIKYVERFNYLNIKPSQAGVDKVTGELMVWVNFIGGEL